MRSILVRSHAQHTRPVIALFLACVVASCGDSLAETAMAPPTPAPPASLTHLPCVHYEGVAHLISDDAQVFHARLTGDAAGTMQIVYTGIRVTGVAEHLEGVFTLDRESGQVLFGDGVRGQRVPVGATSDETYRFGATGALKERITADGASEPVHGRLRIEGLLSPEPATSSLRYWLTECDLAQ